ncbi:MAG: hypothetical protein H6766_06800 [Candidatus Peribacteria bacterium]|nr:MAG: hypothetical protein H6766_06800 [Candidatus Peribacteria bacterium]
MDNTTQDILIKKYLPESLWEKAMQFRINSEHLKTLSDVIILILNSRSIDTDQEKQSWFDLLGLMNEEQIERLRDILTREKQKLEEIERKYEEKKIEIKKKYLLKWQNMNYQKTMSNIKERETGNKEKEEAEADALLQNM